ncbi:OadG family protein [Bacteriovoracaceae bacterium]|nr:OadG family protein [Bacteriovoracaceae bacterium]
MNITDIDQGLKNIVLGQGLSIMVTGIVIVFSALLFICIGIVVLSKMVTKYNSIFPVENEVKMGPKPEMVAAIVKAMSLNGAKK